MSNQEPISSEAAKSMDDIFGVKRDLESGLDTTEKIQAAFEGKDKESAKTSFKKIFTPRTTQETKQSESIIPEVDEVTPARIKALEETLKELKKGLNGVKIAALPEKPIPLDYTKLDESAVYDFDVPIPAIDHGVPDYLTIKLKDPNYVPRWIHKAPRRLGPMLAIGWSFITKEDLIDDISLAVTMDENGQYRFDDVIACKIEKQKYFGQLRRNHERALLQVNPKAHHELAKKAIASALDHPENIGKHPITGKYDRSSSGDYSRYGGQHKIDIYEPLLEK